MTIERFEDSVTKFGISSSLAQGTVPFWGLSWLLALRPKTLLVSFSPILAGSLLAYRADPKHFALSYSLMALISALCIQIGTNLFNDVLDFVKGTDNAQRIGPRRVTQQGWLSPKTVMTGAFCFYFAAAALGIPLVLAGGLPILVLGLVSLLCGYLYTGGPFPLAYKGLGELFVFLFFGLAASCGIYNIQTHAYSWSAVIAGTQMGFLACTLIAINNFRDWKTDILSQKMTLAARFGPIFSRVELTLFFTLPYVIEIIKRSSDSRHHYAPYFLFVFPFALILMIKIWKNEPSEKYNKYLGLASLHQILFTFMVFFFY